jgi:hypothetical protein
MKKWYKCWDTGCLPDYVYCDTLEAVYIKRKFVESIDVPPIQWLSRQIGENHDKILKLRELNTFYQDVIDGIDTSKKLIKRTERVRDYNAHE